MTVLQVHYARPADCIPSYSGGRRTFCHLAAGIGNRGHVVNMARQSALSPVSREARQKLSATIRLSATSEFALDMVANDSLLNDSLNDLR